MASPYAALDPVHRSRRRRPGRLATALLTGAGLAALGASAVLGAGEATPAAQAPDLDAGKVAYERCAVCHGAGGGGREDGTFPKIGGQHRAVVEAQLRAIRAGDRINPLMQPHASALLDEREVVDVATYVASLPKPAASGYGPGDDLERGGRLYRDDCVQCHGERGLGHAEGLVPWLAGQHYAYLLRRARQLASWRQAGHPEAPRTLADYTDAELRAVVDYASRLSGAGPVAGP